METGADRLSRLRRKSITRRATEYMSGVIKGRIPVCKLVRQAVERQLRDLKEPPEGYRFRPEFAEFTGAFCEKMPHPKGSWDSPLIVLEPWQCFLIACLYGWVDGQCRRRFRKAFVLVPRKNGKSTLCACLGIYHLVADGEQGAEVYIAASQRDQASIIARMVVSMVRQAPGMQKQWGVSVRGGDTNPYLRAEANDGVLKALARDNKGSSDGTSPSAGILDELHAHTDTAMLDAVSLGTAARTQPLVMSISTAGVSTLGPCYEMQKHAERVLAQQITDQTFFGIVYTIDDGDRWDDPAVWRKASPNWGVSVRPEMVESEANLAKSTPAQRFAFQTKLLNVWQTARAGWMNMEWVERNRVPDDFDWGRFKGKQVWISADLSVKYDFTAIAYLFKEHDRFYSRVRYFLPQDTVENPDFPYYRIWHEQGWVESTPGGMIDLAHIRGVLEQDLEDYEVRAIGYDPAKTGGVMQELALKGNVIEFSQTPMNFTDPMRSIEALLKDGKLLHDGSPVTEWMFSCVTVKPRVNDTVFPGKDPGGKDKIDGVVAMIIAKGVQSIDDGRPKPEFYIDTLY